ncbi:MAG: hypothetical protein HY737_05750 [Candidatus Omnitrophica bacterium]|nr:hypothetical protein [Candidatus Omnitrophota bacterium]
MLTVCACGRAATDADESPSKEPDVAAPHPVNAELIAEHTTIQPGGATRVGVRFTIEPGWHIYYETPGDAGLPTKIEWSAPSGCWFGPLQWPNPKRFMDPGNIKTFGYEKDVTLISELRYQTVRDAYTELPLNATVSWLACKELCIPGQASLDLTLPVSPEPPARSPRAAVFD